jgi:hypothetical protein
MTATVGQELIDLQMPSRQLKWMRQAVEIGLANLRIAHDDASRASVRINHEHVIGALNDLLHGAADDVTHGSLVAMNELPNFDGAKSRSRQCFQIMALWMTASLWPEFRCRIGKLWKVVPPIRLIGRSGRRYTRKRHRCQQHRKMAEDTRGRRDRLVQGLVRP